MHTVTVFADRLIHRLFTGDPRASAGSHHPRHQVYVGEQSSGYVVRARAAKALPVRPLTVPEDLFDNVYDLVDSLTFKSRNISPNMWRVYELTYELFRTDAIDFLDGKKIPLMSAKTKTDYGFP